MLSEHCPFSQSSEYKRRIFPKTSFSYPLLINRVINTKPRLIRFLNHGHPQFKKNKHGFNNLIHTFCY